MNAKLLRGVFLPIFCFLWTLVLAQIPTTNHSNTDIQALDNYVAKAVVEWQTPGLSIVVVKNGAVLLQKGYGARDITRPEQVDDQTIFACASTTKAVTALALAMLVDEGKIRWSDKVVQHLPEFKVADSLVTKELTIKDLLTHNGGMGNADFLWSQTGWDSKEVMRRFGLIKPAYSLRGGFIYQNVMYMVAGELIEKVTDNTWATFVQSRIFTPLSMTRTFPTLAASYIETNRATPHLLINKTNQVVENSQADAIHAAGSVWSCAEDMGKWLRFLLDSARINGKRLVSAANYTELFRSQTLLPPTFYPTFQLVKPNFTTYGLGWFQHDYQGQKVHFHTGSLNGMVAICGLLPSENVGVYIFANRSGAEIRHALMYRVFDVFLNQKAEKSTPLRDWSSEFKKIYDDLNTQSDSAKARQERSRIAQTTPSVSAEQLVGTYSDPIHGDIEIKLGEHQELRAQIAPRLSASLTHWNYDVYRVEYDKKWLSPSYLQFSKNGVGKVVKVQMGNTSWVKKGE
jgi:CubicO group peptidase (beta-lactamase class C family)